MRREIFSALILSLVVCLTNGCGSFRTPALPQGGAESAPPSPAAPPAALANLRAAEVIYFSLTTNELSDLAAAEKITAALQDAAPKFALGWAEIPAAKQFLFERWQNGAISREEFSAAIVRRGQPRIFERFLRPDFAHVALGCAGELLRKIRDDETLTSGDEKLLPIGFRAAPGAFEDFADRVGESPRLRRYNIRRLYRAHLIAEQTIAENIVGFRREYPPTKLIVFLPNDALIDPHEVALFVRQKGPARQLILDRAQPLQRPSPQLLAGSGGRF